VRQIQILLIISIVFLSCQSQERFDKVKWQTREDPAFPPQSRKGMLKDLQSNYKLEGMSPSQITELLGEPDYKDDSSITYNIEEKYGSDIDPVYTKTLEVKLGNYNTVQAVDVREWKK
jgi:hypothetical protein